MVKIATKPFNFVQQVRNMATPQGKALNRFAKGLKEEGFNQIYQRKWKSHCMISGKNPAGDTKSFLLESSGYSVKINKTTPVTQNTKTREIDKSFRNEYGSEINGINKFQRIINNIVFDTKIKKRGWKY